MRFRPATPADIPAVRPRMTRRHFAALTAQITQWPCWALERDGAVLALMGAAPLEPDTLELWFAAAPGLRGTATGRSAIRLVLMRVALFMPGMTLAVRISDRNGKGQRMARLAGFAPTPEILDGTDIRTWQRGPVE